MTRQAEKITRFQALHSADDLFLMPNPWDVGSAKLFEHLGFPALATTSSGHAATLGRADQQVTRDEMLEHVSRMAAAVDIPLNVDSERCFGTTPQEIAGTVQGMIEAGAAGFSIEDYDPETSQIDPIEIARDRVEAAAETAHSGPLELTLTARAEGYLYGQPDVDEIIARLIAYRDAGADVVYAPGLSDLNEIRAVVEAVEIPLNVLNWPPGPSVEELASAGVRRVSTGGALVWSAYGAAAKAASELLEAGTYSYMTTGLPQSARNAAFG